MLTSGVASLSTGVSSLQKDALQWNSGLGAYDASHGSGSAQKITNVAAATLSATSTDAVNGSQLYNTNSSVASLSTAIGVTTASTTTSLSTGISSTGSAVSSLSTGVSSLRQDALQWNSALGAYDASHGSGSAQKITNVAAATLSSTSTDAVNGSQLYTTNQNLTALSTSVTSGSVGTIQRSGSATNVTVLTASGGTAASPGATQKLTNLANGTVNATSSDAVTGGQLYAVSQNVTSLQTDALLWNSTLGAFDASHGSGVAQKITNVAIGTVSSTSVDAINGSQLYATSKSIANAIGGGAAVNPDGTISAPTYTVQGNSYSSVGSAMGAVDNSLTSLTTQVSTISNGGGVKYSHTNSSLADSQAIGANSLAAGPAAVATGANSIASGTNARSVGDGSTAIGANAVANNAGDVALGSGSTTQAAVQTSTMVVNGTTYNVAGTATSTVSFGSSGAERTITNIAGGRVTATSTDAINGSQLYATNQQVSNLGTQVSTIGTTAKNSVQYDTNAAGNKTNSITLQGGDPNAPVVITNVAAGTADTDAVNMKQFKSYTQAASISANSYTDNRIAYAISSANTYTDTKAAQTLSEANAYTDSKFSVLSSSVASARREARQAAAIGLAAASLRYDDRPGKLSAAIGGGAWRGQGAFAMGLGYMSEDQSLRASFSATTGGGQWGFGTGVSFTLN
ncbi:YadA-like family protein [Methylobacterium aerolatum]|uniref:Autotransporter adhesin n=1 Tax=Methylobacterium aerolatum TaxID=418708 RepID=A0ABU0HYS4_9HYPH|nr:YadA-like family protein [Methylobacterium aerolatum]MDQ0447481.1 autotransporter adhesin [Methylobacterium aerolatum]